MRETSDPLIWYKNGRWIISVMQKKQKIQQLMSSFNAMIDDILGCTGRLKILARSAVMVYVNRLGKECGTPCY